MTARLTPEAFRRMRELLERCSGIALGEEKGYLVESRLAGLVAECGCADFEVFHRLAAQPGQDRLRERMVDAMTTNETLWFRDGHPFTILRERLLPPLGARLLEGGRNRIRIWSAASSTGQEPYSIAMTVHEFCRATPGLRPEQFEILASDISPTALAQAKAGRYDPAALARGLSQARRDRFCHPDGRFWAVNEEVKRLVSFRRFNLQEPLAPLGHFDIVFLRYVCIYFAEPFRRRLCRDLARLLAPDGHLVISAVESLREADGDFIQLVHGGGSYYRCRPAREEARHGA